MTVTYPALASIKIVYALAGDTTKEFVILSQSLSTDVQKKVYDAVYSFVGDKIDALKTVSQLKWLLTLLA